MTTYLQMYDSDIWYCTDLRFSNSSWNNVLPLQAAYQANVIIQRTDSGNYYYAKNRAGETGVLVPDDKMVEIILFAHPFDRTKYTRF